LSDAYAAGVRLNNAQSARPSKRNRETPAIVPTRSVRRLATSLSKMSLPEREAVPGIGPRRAEIIIAGAEVYAELLDSFGLEGFRYSPLGLRGGIRAQRRRAGDHRQLESLLLVVEQSGDQPALVPEPAVDRPLADPGLLRDRVGREGLDAAVGVEAPGRLQDQRPIAGCVGTLAGRIVGEGEIGHGFILDKRTPVRILFYQ